MDVKHLNGQTLMYQISEGNEDSYSQTITNAWHKSVPETRGYTACSMNEATHVVFSETDLMLVGEDGYNFTPNKVYSINLDSDTKDFMIIDDKDVPIIGFDLFIPCEYFKVTSSKVVSLQSYKKRKSRKRG